MVLGGHETGREQCGCLDRSVQAGQGRVWEDGCWEPSWVASMSPKERYGNAFFPEGV